MQTYTETGRKLRLVASVLALALMGGGLTTFSSVALADDTEVCNANLEITHNGPGPEIVNKTGRGSMFKDGENDPKNETGPVYAQYANQMVSMPEGWNFTIKVPDNAKAGQRFQMTFPHPFISPKVPNILTDEATGKELIEMIPKPDGILDLTLKEGVEELNNIEVSFVANPRYDFHETENLDKTVTHTGTVTDCKGKEIVTGSYTRAPATIYAPTVRTAWQGNPDYPTMLTTRLTTQPTKEANTPFTITFAASDYMNFSHLAPSFLHGAKGKSDFPKTWSRMKKGEHYTVTKNDDGSVTVKGVIPSPETQIDMYFQSKLKNPPASPDPIPTTVIFTQGEYVDKEITSYIYPPSFSGSGAGTPADAMFGDTVFLDKNKNGVQDKGEPGVPDVGIEIIGKGFGKNVKTGKDGKYSSGDIRPGEYSIVVTPPPGYLFTTQGEGSVVDENGKYTFSLSAKEKNLDIDIGLVEGKNSLAVKKTADVEEGATLGYGATVNWTYTVQNTGDFPMKIDSIVDDQGVKITCPKMEVAVGESVVCTGSGQVK